MIIHNIEEGQYTEDEEVLSELQKIKAEKDTVERDGNIVQIVTDDYLSWNKLKSHLLSNPQEFKSQLRINENALKNNPKSYQTWYHRMYMMKHFPEQMEKFLEREDFLTGLLLDSDPRNFHCWNYRAYLFGRRRSNAGHDLFNYSYLHHHPGMYDPLSLVYTDPLDAVGWEYFRTCRERKRLETGVYIRRYPTYLEIRFKDLFHGELTLKADGVEKAVFQDFETKFISIEGATKPCDKYELIVNHHEMSLSLGKEEFGFIDEVLNLEPKSYNGLLTLLDYVEEEAERNKIIERLAELDPIRGRYYSSLVNEFYAIYVL